MAGGSIASDSTTGAMGAALGGLTSEQRQAVLVDDEPLCVLAGPGSGKTTVLTRRVARRVVDGSINSDRTAVVTFTRKAASELRHRLSALQVPGRVWAGTFHGAALAHLRRHRADRGMARTGVLDDPRRLLRRVGGEALVDPAVVAALATEVHWAQVRMVEPAQYRSAAEKARRRAPIDLTLGDVGSLYARYCDEKRRRGVVDLDDLVTESAKVLESDPEACAVQRWRTRHLFVDEFQDVNPAQWRLLAAWLGDRRDLFVVGDPHQAVYAWNGADPGLLDTLPDLLPGTVVLNLNDNHRSTPQVESVARSVLGRLHGAGRATRPDGPMPVVRGFDDDEAEAAGVVRWLRLAHGPGRSWSQLAVLARTNARLEPIGRALRRAGIPYRAASTNPHPARGRDRSGTSDPSTAALSELRRHRGTSLRSALAELVVSADDEDSTVRDERRWDAVQNLVRLGDEHAVDTPDATVDDFLAWLAADGGTESELVGRDVVALSTFHRAKGLQWLAVAIVGLEDGLVPISYADSADELAEERRLLYVAVTRAEDELWCSWAHERRVGDRTWRCQASPFVAAMTSAGIDGATSPAPLLTAVEQIGRLRTRLADAG